MARDGLTWLYVCVPDQPISDELALPVSGLPGEALPLYKGGPLLNGGGGPFYVRCPKGAKQATISCCAGIKNWPFVAAVYDATDRRLAAAQGGTKDVWKMLDTTFKAPDAADDQLWSIWVQGACRPRFGFTIDAPDYAPFFSPSASQWFDPRPMLNRMKRK